MQSVLKGGNAEAGGGSSGAGGKRPKGVILKTSSSFYRTGASCPKRAKFDEEESDEEFKETPEKKARRIEFERRRKAHYKQYKAVKLARKLIDVELDDYEDGDDSNETSNVEKSISQAPASAAEYQAQERDSQSSCNIQKMDIDIPVGHTCEGGAKSM